MPGFAHPQVRPEVHDGPDRPGDVHQLRAFEIWGGNEATCDHITTPGFEAHIYCEPHEGAEVGGDLRFVSTCAAGAIVRFTLADVAGHGPSVAETALRLRALIRKHINTPNPTKFANQLNRELSALSREGRFATAVINTYFAPTDHLIVCNAGHPRPLLYRSSERRWELFDETSPGALSAERSKETGISNLPLGILHPTSYPQFATHLVPGDIVISYTDALVEAADQAGNALGEEGLLAIVAGLDADKPGALGPAILGAVAKHRGNKPADDDVSLLVLYHTASDPPKMAFGERLKVLGKLVGVIKYK